MFRYSMQPKYFFHEDMSYANCFMGRVNKYKVSFLAQLVHNHYDSIMFPRYLEYSHDEVHGYDFPFPFQDED